jgi:hypothetical protein
MKDVGPHPLKYFAIFERHSAKIRHLKRPLSPCLPDGTTIRHLEIQTLQENPNEQRYDDCIHGECC